MADEVASTLNRLLEGQFISTERLMKCILELNEEYDRICQELKRQMSRNRNLHGEMEHLRDELAGERSETTSLFKQLRQARLTIDEEKRKLEIVSEERDSLEHQLDVIRSILHDSGDALDPNTRQKLSLLSKRQRQSSVVHDTMDVIHEMETTGSLISDLSFTREEDNMHSPQQRRRSKRKSAANTPATVKKRKSSRVRQKELNAGDRIVTTTTVTLDSNGPISTVSTVETVMSPEKENYRPSAPPLSADSASVEEMNDVIRSPGGDSATPFNMNTINTRPHSWAQKAMIKGETCNVCSKRMFFSSMGAKCQACKTVTHVRCQDEVPLPCVPVGHTPVAKVLIGTIADFTPSSGLMVPSILIHCIKEIESRGLQEVGLYRIPGSEKEVRSLKEKFLKSKGVPNLAQINDIHVICGCLKDFLRSLKEPLVTYSRHQDFITAANYSDYNDRSSRLLELVRGLPQPNRDTLAFLVLHLQKVAASPACKMPVSNLSKMFGLSVVGCTEEEQQNMVTAANQSNHVMEELLLLPEEYWQPFLRDQPLETSTVPMEKTPSANSLVAFFTPSKTRSSKKYKYFGTP